ncbi:lysozyme inhibitor LprI family protein [Erwinia phyllosphaerae]|uniref:lysozyme inhibitor LprI family protein n=1 Tax=Erwinia phyllosphaerae TaxID=2853256 RepID=UPI001FEEA7E0|nr:lysozyme inhibitor LprI family protein [Erwinia phyllosphaerae]MBV4368229.1 DUF1311 domain-containing protein [Erwinia phyllosphaerae]
MNKFIGFIVVAFLIPFSTSVFASDICDAPQAEGDVIKCSVQKKDKAEDSLNKQFSEAKKTIEHAYRSHTDLGKEYFNILLDAQRGWLKYRDAQCKLEAFAAEDGSSANIVATNECIATLDNERSENLKKIPY